MSNCFIGEIRIFGFNFAPRDWAFCDGQLLAISQNTALFSIIGTYFGGNGINTFALPNFQGRTGIHQGQGAGLSYYDIGEPSGTATVTLTQGQLPHHSHTINTMEARSTTQAQHSPSAQAYLGSSSPDQLYDKTDPSPTAQLEPSAIALSGQGVPHDNMQPYETLNFCICMFGIYPSRN